MTCELGLEIEGVYSILKRTTPTVRKFSKSLSRTKLFVNRTNILNGTAPCEGSVRLNLSVGRKLGLFT